MQDENNNGWVKLYHPSGAQVTFPVSLMAEITSQQALNAFNSVNVLLGIGFSVNPAGVEAGELIEEVASVARRTGSDGTPIVAFFKDHPKLVKKFLHTYLNNPDEIAEFERATGLHLDALPNFESDKDITKDHRLAHQYITPLPHPVKLVYKISDRWKQWDAAGGNGQQPQKNELLRYLSNGTPNQAHPQPGTTPDYSQTKTPGGLLISTLDEDKLNKIVNINAANVTQEMRDAARHYLNQKGK